MSGLSGISATCTTGLAGVSGIAAVTLRGSSISGDTIRGEHSSKENYALVRGRAWRRSVPESSS